MIMNQIVAGGGGGCYGGYASGGSACGAGTAGICIIQYLVDKA